MPHEHAPDRQREKKERERFYLEKFLEASQIRPLVIEEPLETSGEPDFVLHFQYEKVAVELSQLFADSDRPSKNGSESRRREIENAQRISRIARLAYSQYGAKAIKVTFINQVPTCENSTAKELADISRSLAVEQSEDMELADGCRIHILRLPESFKGYFRWTHVPTHTGWVRKVEPDFFSRSLESKSQRIDSYKRYADRVFLLFYVERSFTSGFFERAGEDGKVLKSGFDRVFMLHYPPCRLFEL